MNYRTVVAAITFFILQTGHLQTSAAQRQETDTKTTKKKSGTLVICGGGAMPSEVMDQFVELAGGNSGRMVVIPTASSSYSKDDQASIVARWMNRGVESVTVLHTDDPKVANSEEFVQPLKTATAIWISGGAQSRLAKSYIGTATEREIMKFYQRGGVIGGSSAGAAIQSRIMIQSGSPTPTITTGLDLLPRAIIDQHFLRRNRFNRLLFAVRKHSGCTGVGIDEGTGIVYHDGKSKVVGVSYVSVVEIDGETKLLSVKTYGSGKEFLWPGTAKKE